MAFDNYSEHVPGISIEQRLVSTTEATAPVMASCIVGPRFELNRYGKETTPEVTFGGSEQDVPLQYTDADGDTTTLDTDTHAVDAASLKLYGKNLEAQMTILTNASGTAARIASLATPNILKCSANRWKGGTLLTELRGRAVAVGDLMYCQGVTDGTIYRRTVIGFQGVAAAGTYGSNTAGTNSTVGGSNSNPIASSAAATQVTAPTGWSVSCASPGAFNGLARGARYGTEYGEVFTLTVNATGAPATGTVNITSASGLFQATGVATVNSSGNFSITNSNAGGELAGVTLLLTPPGGTTTLTSGLVFSIKIIGLYERVSDQIVVTGTFSGSYDTTYMMRVTDIGTADFDDAIVEITDTAGNDLPFTETIVDGTPFALGSSGLSIEFDSTISALSQGMLRKGDVYYVHGKAGVISTTEFDKIVLNGPAVDTLTFDDASVALKSVSQRLLVTGEITTDSDTGFPAWAVDGHTITVESGLQHRVTDRDADYEWCTFVAAKGTLIPSYRAFVLAGADDALLAVTSVATRLTNAGAYDLDNDLGFAAAEALKGSQGKRIYVLNTGGSALSDYETALTKIANNRTPYDLCLMSDDAATWEMALEHAVSASAPDVRNSRRIRVGIDSPGKYLVLSTKADTTNFTATVSPNGSGNLLVTISSGSSEALLTTRDLSVGDLVIFPGVDDTEYPIAEVVSDTELLLSTGPGAAIDPADTIQIWKADTVANQKSYLLARAAALQDRRFTVNWIERPTAPIGTTTEVIPARFGAAYLSGVRSYLPPQVGTTRQSVPTFTAAPRMYTRYTFDDLNEIAAGGIQIITQETADGPIRVRHQVTTETEEGLLAFEENTTVRMDYLTQLFDAVMDVAIGKTNAVPDQVSESRSDLLRVLSQSKLKGINDLYGPLIDDFDQLSVELDPLLLDRINSSVTVGIGPPLNRHHMVLTGTGRILATA